MNGHDLGNHCPTPAVTSAVLTSKSNCLPRLTLDRPQINALMPNSVSAVGGLSPLGVGWFSQPIPTIIYPYFLFQAEVWVIGSPFGKLGRGVRVNQLLHQLSFSDRPEPPALTTVFPLVSQDRLGKPQPKGHPLRGRLPFIVWVRLHLPTHYCVSQSSPVA